MKRIIIHWTAGRLQPNSTDYEHYHYLIKGNGEVIKGNYTPEDNENCLDGKYAKHTGGGNTGSIGIAMCGMFGFINRENCGKDLLTKEQCEACFKLAAKLCKKYNIKVSTETIMTHYEFNNSHPKASKVKKIDIIYLPPYPYLQQSDIGDFIRNKILEYLQ